MRRIVRLNENDLARIVRRVLKEENNFSGCFTGTKLTIPPSCDIETTGGMVGTGLSIGDNCISDLKNMITFDNLIEIGKILVCLGGLASPIESINKGGALKKATNNLISNVGTGALTKATSKFNNN